MLYILALDGLDYDVVQNLNLSNLLQKKHGKLKVPINKTTGCPSSPEVWASFLCAEHIEMGFMRTERKKNQWILKFLFPMRFPIRRISKRFFPYLTLGIHEKTVGDMMGFPELKRETWIDKNNIEEIDVPYYSYTNEAFVYSKEFSEDRDLEKYRKKIRLLYLKKTSDLLSKTKKILNESKGIDIIFAYLHFPDLLQHLWCTKKDKINEHYLEINNFVLELQGILKSTPLLIISDHGFDFSKRIHSNFGFISSSLKMSLPKSIIELGKQIKNGNILLSVQNGKSEKPTEKETEQNLKKLKSVQNGKSEKPTEKETEQILKKLKELGYI